MGDYDFTIINKYKNLEDFQHFSICLADSSPTVILFCVPSQVGSTYCHGLALAFCLTHPLLVTLLSVGFLPVCRSDGMLLETCHVLEDRCCLGECLGHSRLIHFLCRFPFIPLKKKTDVKKSVRLMNVVIK